MLELNEYLKEKNIGFSLKRNNAWRFWVGYRKKKSINLPNVYLFYSLIYGSEEGLKHR